jgi:hypothetical protein
LGLCVYKFNLVVPLVPLALLLHLRWKALGGFFTTAITAALISVWLVPPSAYLALLRELPVLFPTTKLGGLRGWLLAVHLESLYLPLALVGLVLVAVLIRKIDFQYAFCTALIAGLLLGYQSAWYDLTILVIPMGVLWHRQPNLLFLGLLQCVPLWFLWQPSIQVVTEAMLLVPVVSLPTGKLTAFSGSNRIPLEIRN